MALALAVERPGVPSKEKRGFGYVRGRPPGGSHVCQCSGAQSGSHDGLQ